MLYELRPRGDNLIRFGLENVVKRYEDSPKKKNSCQVSISIEQINTTKCTTKI
ncbi:hypothetical protein HOA56_05710 [archaeon]|nr:hypothetical protein [archaeon]